MTSFTAGRREESAPMLTAVWGSALAPDVASMIVASPDLGRCLALAPARAVHAMAIFIYAQRATGRTAREVGEDIERYDVRDLLRRAMPNVHSRLYGVLDQVGGRVRRVEFYAALNDALHGAAGDLLLRGGRIDREALEAVEQVVRDPVLLAARHTVGRSQRDVRLMLSILSYLRGAGLAKTIEALPEGSGWSAILRRIEDDLARARAPIPPFPPPEGWEVVEDVGTLWQVGRHFGNCVAGLATGQTECLGDLIVGRTVFLVRHDEPELLAAIRRVGLTVWLVEQIAGRKNAAPPHEARMAFQQALSDRMATAGHALVDEDPLRGLAELSRRAQRSSMNGFDDDWLFAA